MFEEVILLKDLKLVPDKYYEYTQALQNAQTPIVIDNGNYIITFMYYKIKYICC